MPTRKQIEESAKRSAQARLEQAEKEARDAAKRAAELEKETQRLETFISESSSATGIPDQRLETAQRNLKREQMLEAEAQERAAGIQNPEGLTFGETLTEDIEQRQSAEESGQESPFNLGRDGVSDMVGGIAAGIGSVGESGPTASQKRAIETVDRFLKEQQRIREENEKKSETQKARGTFITPEQQNLPEMSPDFLSTGAQMTQDLFEDQLNIALANQKSKEALRENQLRQQLSKLSLGSEEDNVLSSLEKTMGKLSLPQLEMLATQDGLELTDDLKDSLTRHGKSAIETEKITTDMRLAENEYSKKQLSRTYDRAITDREEFNVQQDAKMRRAVAQFGGGTFQSLGGNVAVMNKREEGQRAVEELKSEYSDKTMLVSQQADAIILTYNKNVRLIEDQMAQVQENKLTEITNTIDDLLEAGVSNEVELNNAIIKAKSDYVKSYGAAQEKAYDLILKQNQQLFNNQVKLRQLKLQEDKARQTSRFDNRFGVASTPSSNTTGMQVITSQSQWAANCVKYAREMVPNLPFGLFTKADKQRAVQEEGFRDPSMLKAGDAVVTSEGDVGHVAIVVGEQNGQLVLEEANYSPGQVTRGRLLDVNDPKIYGFIPSMNAPAVNIGGNIELEGTNESIEGQIGTEQFQPKTELDQLAQNFLTGDVDELDLGRRGFSEDEINTITQRANQIESQFGIRKQKASQTAQDIFNLTSNLRLADLPNKERASVENELNKLREEALAAGDFEGTLRASAGGKALDATAIQKLSKTATVVNQVGLLNNALNRDSITDENGNLIDLSPLTGFFRRRNPWDAPAQEINAIIQGTIPNLARGVFGEVGVLTDRDVELYRKTLPTLSQTDQVKKSVTALTLRTLRSSLEDQLQINAGAGRDVSDFLT